MVKVNSNFEISDGDKIALFDFCETIVNFQSADAYVKYALSHMKRGFKARACEIFRKFLVKSRLMFIAHKFLFFIEGNINKKLILRQLSGSSQQELEALAEKFYQEIVRPNYIQEVINEIKRLKYENFKLFIVSGGYDIYIKYVADEFNFDGILCTELEFKDGIFTGRYKGSDCMGKNKIKFLKKYLGCDNLKIFDSVVYSDSPSDLPLFNCCQRGVAVYRDVPKWINENNLEGLAYHA